jgi:hypothetical protein
MSSAELALSVIYTYQTLTHGRSPGLTLRQGRIGACYCIHSSNEFRKA